MSTSFDEAVSTLATSPEVSDGSAGATAEGVMPSSTKNVSVETKTYRTYGIVTTDEKGETEFKAYGEKNPDGTRKILPKPIYSQSTADGKAWKKAEENENLKLSENNFIFYVIENLEGFEELVPDPEQRLYIVQKGVQALQIQKANALQAELTEDGSFKYDQVTLDLRDQINEAPRRKSLSGIQKISRDLEGLSEADRVKLMDMLMAMQQS